MHNVLISLRGIPPGAPHHPFANKNAIIKKGDLCRMRTLLLDQTFFPVKIINWQKAMILFLTGRAEVLDVYEHLNIRSVSESFKLPKVLRLLKRHKNAKHVKFSRENVFIRDNFTCQYCYHQFKQKELTFDHVVPVSKNGPTTWENVVTACRPCNTKKGDKNLKDLNLRLKTKPQEPSWSPRYGPKIEKNDPKDWFNWFGLK